MDDVFSTESALVATVTAAVLSPKTRETMRRGAVYGLAGLLRAGDVAAGAARGAVRGIRGGGGGDAQAPSESTTTPEASTAGTARTARTASTRRAAATAKAARTETDT